MDNWKEKIDINKKQGVQLFSSCGRCASKTRHKIIVSVDVDASCDAHPFRIGSEVFHGEVWSIDSYQIVQCGGCDFVSFRHSSYFSEDTELRPAGDEYDSEALVDVPVERVSAYPKRIPRRDIEEDHLLPKVIRAIYNETKSSLANKENILGGMGIRALVELVAKDRGATGNSLAKKIDSLVAQGLLTESKGKFLHILRDMGNESAHEGKEHSENELLTALDIVEHLLEDVYVLPSKVEGLPVKSSRTC